MNEQAPPIPDRTQHAIGSRPLLSVSVYNKHTHTHTSPSCFSTCLPENFVDPMFFCVLSRSICFYYLMYPL